MKRYSISIAYGRDRKTNKIRFHYSDRTDDVEHAIAFYKECLAGWIECLNDEGYQYRNQTDDYHGIKITDSQTKKTVYQEVHLSEEYGWKKEWTERSNQYGWTYWHGEFVKA